jgi:hypothetical protein
LAVQNVTGSAKKQRSRSVFGRAALFNFFNALFYGFAGAGVGAGAGAVVGMAVVPSSALRVEIVSIEPSPVCVFMAVAARQRTTKTEARVHVAFSKKSVVLRTPITWLLAEKVEDNPPPFEF